ncbi:MAG: YfiR family protein [Congregibacter sp.]
MRQPLLWFLGLVLPALLGERLCAQDNIEEKLKAAYLINIMSFVRWKDDKNEAVICLHQNSSVAPYVLSENGRVLGNHTTLRTITAWDEWSQCDVFYWDESSSAPLPTAALEAQQQSLLTVSDRKGALADGFAVQFYMRNLKLRFAMNNDVIQSADYRISSKLLRLSRQVD